MYFIYKRKRNPRGDASSAQNTELSAVTIPSVKKLKNITVEGKLGSGNFGEVYKGLWRNNPVALKKLKTAEQFAEFEREATLLQ
jgi:predicted Ser/Thr protein kinase